MKPKLFLIVIGIILGLLAVELFLQIASGAAYLTQRANLILNSEGTYKILALGESTTANLYNMESTWPSQLETILNNKSAKKRFTVYNEGIPGTTSDIILSRLEKNIKKYRPDMVVTMIGINDIKDSVINVHKIKFIDFKLPKLAYWLAHNLRKNSNEELTCNKERIPGEFKSINEAKNFIDNQEFDKALNLIDSFQTSEKSCAGYCAAGDIYWALARNKPDKKNQLIEKAKQNYKMGFNFDKECNIRYLLVSQEAKLGDSNSDFTFLAEEMILNENFTQKEIDLIYSVLLTNLNINSTSKNKPYITYFYGYNNIYFNNSNPKNDALKDNYRKLNYLLKSNGIIHIAMQYPLQPVSTLKGYFNESSNIIFVSNEKNFESALKKYKRHEIFNDYIGEIDPLSNKTKLGGKQFGHATKLGNKIIAENLANVILDELNIS